MSLAYDRAKMEPSLSLSPETLVDLIIHEGTRAGELHRNADFWSLSKDEKVMVYATHKPQANSILEAFKERVAKVNPIDGAHANGLCVGMRTESMKPVNRLRAMEAQTIIGVSAQCRMQAFSFNKLTSVILLGRSSSATIRHLRGRGQFCAYTISTLFPFEGADRDRIRLPTMDIELDVYRLIVDNCIS